MYSYSDRRWCSVQRQVIIQSLMALLIWLLPSRLGVERISGVHRQAFG